MYNHERPHSALGGRTPAQMVADDRTQLRPSERYRSLRFNQGLLAALRSSLIEYRLPIGVNYGLKLKVTVSGYSTWRWYKKWVVYTWIETIARVLQYRSFSSHIFC